MRIFLLSFAVLAAVHSAVGNSQAANEAWETYWSSYGSFYGNGASEAYIRLYYNYNRHVLDKLNMNMNRTDMPYRLEENQFTGMRYRQFKAMFPQIRAKKDNGIEMDLTDFPADPPEFNFDPFTALGLNVQIPIEDQGTKCNAGWAYAVAKAIEIREVMNIQMPIGSLSAQRFIDCAGTATACKNQAPQTAFDYLTVGGQTLYDTIDYQNKPELAVPDMCLMPANPMSGYNLSAYVCIEGGNETIIRRALANMFPVVIEVDPKSFEFMHYSSGVFQQPAKKKEVGSHFMVALGYGTDTDSNLPYWTLVNSFGKTWGENGLMRLDRNTPIKTACFPYN